MSDIKTNSLLVDRTGERYSRLVVLQYLGGSMWLCQCDCGQQKSVRGSHLGVTKSCGCLRRKADGATAHPDHDTYTSMISRCEREAHPDYANYGGRGISVCDRWKESFWNFSADMGKRPDGHLIERINNDKGYSPDNCRWSSRTEQNNNKRTNRLVTHDGETLTVAQWARRLGISHSSLTWRLNRYGRLFV